MKERYYDTTIAEQDVQQKKIDWTAERDVDEDIVWINLQ
jgi:hypothetical protein